MYIAAYSAEGALVTNPTWLPPGDEERNYMVDIQVDVADDYGASSQFIVTIQVRFWLMPVSTHIIALKVIGTCTTAL